MRTRGDAMEIRAGGCSSLDLWANGDGGDNNNGNIIIIILSIDYYSYSRV